MRGTGEHEIAWFGPDGQEMDESDWADGFARILGVYLNGDTLDEVDQRGQPVVGDSFLLLMNAHSDAVDFLLPGSPFGTDWLVELDTSALTVGPTPRDRVGAAVRGGQPLPLPGHSTVVLRRVRTASAHRRRQHTRS